MTDGDLSIEEKRVYDEKTGATEAYVAADVGVLRVSVSDDLVGEFGLRLRASARDVTAGGGYVAAATDEGVHLSADGETFEPTGFGAAYGGSVAVGVHDGRVVAAAETGTVARLVGGDWRTLGTVEAVCAVDAGLVAAADGVYRITDDGLTHVGLTDVADVAGRGVPLAATSTGLYALGNGWMDVREGAFDVVDSDGERAHAVAAAGSVRSRASATAEWAASTLDADDSPMGFAYAPGQTLAVGAAGTLFATVGDGWRRHPLGVTGVGAVAVR